MDYKLKPERRETKDRGCWQGVVGAFIGFVGMILVALLDTPNTPTYQPLFVTIINMFINDSVTTPTPTTSVPPTTVPTPSVPSTTPQPTFTLTTVATFTPSRDIPPTSISTSIPSDVKHQLDALLGSGNWFCFPRSGNDIGINMKKTLTVKPPLSKVEHWGKLYTKGEAVPGLGAATATSSLPISSSDCPETQQAFLSEWNSMANASVQLNALYFDDMLGREKWACGTTSGRVTSIVITSTISQLTVAYPFNSLDAQDGKYGVGETLKDINAGTLWLALYVSVPLDICP